MVAGTFRAAAAAAIIGLIVGAGLLAEDAQARLLERRPHGRAGARRVAPSLRTGPVTTLSHSPAPSANIKISTGASNAVAAGNGFYDLGDFGGLAFHGGVFHPAWTDNSTTLPANPDLPGARSQEIAAARVTVSGATASVAGVSNVSALTGHQFQPSVSINPVNPLNVVAVSNDSTLGLFKSYSNDGGVTWSSSIIADGLDALDEACCDPRVAFDSFGNCFLVYLTESQSGFFTCAVALSTDGGLTFSRVGTVGSDDLEQPMVATGPGPNGNGSVWITYYDFTANNEDGAVVVAGALVTGLGSVGNFTQQVASGSSSGVFPEIAVGPTGQVLLAYQDADVLEGPSAVTVRLDTNGLSAGGFGSAIALGSTNVGWFDLVPAQPNRGISAEVNLAWDRSGGQHHGRVYLVYTDEAVNESNDTNVYLRYSDNNGSAWSAPVLVNDDGGNRSQFFPRVAVDQTNGNVAITWYDCRNDPGSGQGTDSDGAANTDVELWGATVINPDAGTIRLAGSTLTVAEAAGSLSIEITRSGAATAAVSVDYATLNGTATAGSDYTSGSGTVPFAVGESSKTVQVPITLDNLLEVGETFTFSLSNATGGATLGTPGSAAVTITDDIAATAPSDLSATPVSPGAIRLTWLDNSANEDAFQVWRKAGAGAFAPLATTAANAEEHLDGTAAVGTTYTYQVRAVKDPAASAFSDEASAQINTFKLDAASYSIAETASAITVTVQRAGNTSSEASVELQVAAVSATAGEDFTASPSSVSFGIDETSKAVTIPITPDRLLEGPETFTLSLVDPSSGYIVATPGSADVSIQDDLSAPAPTGLTATVQSASEIALSWTDNCLNETGFEIQRQAAGGGTTLLMVNAPDATSFVDTGLSRGVVYTYQVRAVRPGLATAYSSAVSETIEGVQFTSSLASVAESGGAVTLTVTRTGSGVGEVSVDYATSSETAVDGVDFTGVQGTLTFPDGDTNPKTIVVMIAADTAVETDETFAVSLSNPSGIGLGVPSQVTVTLTDDRAATRPTNLTAAALAASLIRLAWQDNSTNETGFRVERSLAGGAFTTLATVAPGVTTFDDTSVIQDSPHTYRVRAVAGASTSNPSNEASAESPSKGKLTVSPKKLNFGKVKVGKTKIKKLKLKNNGKAVLFGEVGAIDPRFTILSGAGPFELAPKKTLVVQVQYAPTAPDTVAATLVVTSTDPRKPTTSVSIKAKAK